MFERFTTNARLTVIAAEERARDRGADRIRTEHLLLGLFGVPNNLAVAILNALGVDRNAVEQAVDAYKSGGPVSEAEALATLGIDIDQVRRRVEEAFGPGALQRRRASDGPLSRHLPFERESKKALELALREAVRLKHNSIGTEHLLLGLLHSEGAARTILADRGIQLDAARIIVEEMVDDRRAG
jgi:ATP-dependent Clp protease ATP-binding subunit ClpA